MQRRPRKLTNWTLRRSVPAGLFKCARPVCLSGLGSEKLPTGIPGRGTNEYSTRTAWEAIYRLLKRGPAPPDVYQGQYDLKGVWAATKVFLGLTAT